MRLYRYTTCGHLCRREPVTLATRRKEERKKNRDATPHGTLFSLATHTNQALSLCSSVSILSVIRAGRTMMESYKGGRAGFFFCLLKRTSPQLASDSSPLFFDSKRKTLCSVNLMVAAPELVLFVSVMAFAVAARRGRNNPDEHSLGHPDRPVVSQ